MRVKGHEIDRANGDASQISAVKTLQRKKKMIKLFVAVSVCVFLQYNAAIFHTAS